METALLIIILSLVFSAFFSGMEIAFISANRLKIEIDKNKNKITGKILSWFNDREANFITMLLLGNNIAIVLYGIYMESFIGPKLNNLLPSYLSGPIVVLLLNTIISTLIILIFAEFIPKATFRLNSNKIIEIFSIPLAILYFLLLPFIFAFLKISELILKNIFRIEVSSKKYVFTTTDLDHYIQEFHNEDNEDSEEINDDLQILKNAIDFQSTKIRECMVPRTEIAAIDQYDSIENLLDLFHKTGHSKILVYNENIDDIIGYVHAFDLIKKPKSIIKILRDIIFIPETMAANEMLQQMINEKNNIAVVLDEFGGTSGILTLEDLMEEIFGEIEDEFDKDQLIEKQIDENTYIFSARLEIDYINEVFHLGLEDSEEYETLGGFIITFHESIPQKGAKFEIGNYTFEILQASMTKIDLVKISRNNT